MRTASRDAHGAGPEEAEVADRTRRVRLDPLAVENLDRIQHELAELGFGPQERTAPMVVSALVFGARAYHAEGPIRALIRRQAVREERRS